MSALGPSTYLAGVISTADLQVLLKQWHGQAESSCGTESHMTSSGHGEPWTLFPDLPLTFDKTPDTVPQFPKH